jgi:hypothetical protein
MEGVEGLMGKLRLSEEERGGVKIGGGGSRRSHLAEPQVVGKILVEKLVSIETLERTLEHVWCPIKGVLCKDLGENHFLFTFLQASGKRRALEDGLWMISKDPVIMEDFDESKTLDEMEFIHIQIWVRVSNLPFGMMDKETGATLGEKIGVFKNVDMGEDGTAVGRVLRIKVLINIRKTTYAWYYCEGRESREGEVVFFCLRVSPRFLLHVWSHWPRRQIVLFFM